MTGDLWIGDVGQNAREEIDVYLFGSNADKNYGWRLREGTIQTPAGGIGGARPADNVEPVYDYLHNGGAFGGFSTTGGYVYRGPIQDLQGLYFFGDFVSERFWSFRYDGSTTFDGTNFTGLRDWTNIVNVDVGNIDGISSFGEDLAGNLYIVDLAGEIFMVTDANLTTEINAIAFNAVRGFLANGGTVADVVNSDDQYLEFNPGFTLNSTEPPVWIEFAGISTNPDPSMFNFTLEARANTPNIVQLTELLNVNTGQWETLDTRNASFNVDSVVTVTATGDVSRFINSADNNIVLARGSWRANGFVLLFPWLISIDQAQWTIIE